MAVYPPAHPRWWLVYLVSGMVAVVAYYLVPKGVATAAIYQLIGLSSAVAVLVGVRVHQPVRRSPCTKRRGRQSARCPTTSRSPTMPRRRSR